jgi:hypothetical protein
MLWKGMRFLSKNMKGKKLTNKRVLRKFREKEEFAKDTENPWLRLEKK